MAFRFFESFFDTRVSAEIMHQLHFLVHKLKAEFWFCLFSHQWFLSRRHHGVMRVLRQYLWLFLTTGFATIPPRKLSRCCLVQLLHSSIIPRMFGKAPFLLGARFSILKMLSGEINVRHIAACNHVFCF